MLAARQAWVSQKLTRTSFTEAMIMVSTNKCDYREASFRGYRHHLDLIYGVPPHSLLVLNTNVKVTFQSSSSALCRPYPQHYSFSRVLVVFGRVEEPLCSSKPLPLRLSRVVVHGRIGYVNSRSVTAAFCYFLCIESLRCLSISSGECGDPCMYNYYSKNSLRFLTTLSLWNSAESSGDESSRPGTIPLVGS